MTFLLTTSRTVGFFGVLANIVLSLVLGIDRPHTGLSGVAEHFIAYYSTAFAFALEFRSKASRVAIALGLTLLVGSMEVLQLWLPGRHSGMVDAVDRILRIIASEIRARPEQVKVAIGLLDEGATVPFVARYRKEAAGGLDDTQLRQLEERLVYL